MSVHDECAAFNETEWVRSHATELGSDAADAAESASAAAQALRGEYERALSRLDGLRAEATALASATDGVLRAEPCAMALLEWWAAHTNACYTAYGGMRHADAAVEEAVEAQAADGRLTRCPLKGTTGDALFAVLCACGHKIRKMLAHLRALLTLLIGAILSAFKADRTQAIGGAAA